MVRMIIRFWASPFPETAKNRLSSCREGTKKIPPITNNGFGRWAIANLDRMGESTGCNHFFLPGHHIPDLRLVLPEDRGASPKCRHLQKWKNKARRRERPRLVLLEPCGRLAVDCWHETKISPCWKTATKLLWIPRPSSPNIADPRQPLGHLQIPSLF